ncbi:Regulator of sirC expression, contains transglutaminase-like and TPR domains [Sphingomonas sp. NFR04]|uniref:SirB1 family protein n=1 Tax=Sphingomonas sp. NFR04 TaxID=1566283 RepID=UPI0008EA7F25|nr:transglutaminase-like domain-containing protein [Sphingomonas sp. NFR04]SFK37054.1 Regulator of sirC expression, contains transglutaminase-like and TPR domains [Sphingomonas sp. NFR04]
MATSAPTDAILQLGLMEDEAIDLDAAALQLAALDHPDVDLGPYVGQLNDFTEQLATVGGDAETVEERAQVLAEVMAQTFGFSGDRSRYDDPANADLIRVIDRRRGLPVSLTILYVAAARRLGWRVDALNTPGHVLARLGSETQAVLIDPFNDGRIVAADDLATLLRGVLGPAVVPTIEHVTPMSNRSVLVRLLMNQASRAEAAGDAARALTLYERMTVIAPDHGQGWWERARLLLRAGEIGGARSSLSAMLEITRDQALRTHICSALDSLSGRD